MLRTTVQDLDGAGTARPGPAGVGRHEVAGFDSLEDGLARRDFESPAGTSQFHADRWIVLTGRTPHGVRDRGNRTSEGDCRSAGSARSCSRPVRRQPCHASGQVAETVLNRINLRMSMAVEKPVLLARPHVFIVNQMRPFLVLRREDLLAGASHEAALRALRTHFG